MKIKGRVDSPERLGKLLQQGRALRGISQRELAAELGVSQRYIHEIETGKHSKFADRLFAMARATNVDLFGELDYEPLVVPATDLEPDHG
jgi:HTH-type transcriptional regulator/antitoxin HipB